MMRVLVLLAWLFVCGATAMAQDRFTPPTIEGFNPRAPSIVSGGTKTTKPAAKKASKKATRSQARRNQPVPRELYGSAPRSNPLPGQITAPMPSPNDVRVPPPVPPASPLASPPPGQSCDPYGPGHCGIRWR